MSSFLSPITTEFLFFIIVLTIASLALIVTRKLLKVSSPYFFFGLVGLIIGLVVGSLASSPFSKLPGTYGRWLPSIINIFITVAILDLFLAQTKLLTRFFTRLLPGEKEVSEPEILVDTSALIDGRIDEITKTGFIFGKITFPRFVLNELQTLADSTSFLKRAKGQRGLEILNLLQKNPTLKINFLEAELGRGSRVDTRLIKLAQARGAKILTTDYNLAQLAQVQGVEVLNINQLATSLKSNLLPGENLIVKIVQKGKEKGQGVGYLEDGTMVVVEQGENSIGQAISCQVVRVYQTVSGKMVFAQPVGKRS